MVPDPIPIQIKWRISEILGSDAGKTKQPNQQFGNKQITLLQQIY